MVEDDPESNWNDCRVIDISVIGVGVELFGDARARDLLEHRLVVHVQPPVGESVSIRLRGQVKSLRREPDGGTRAGLVFTEMSETEQQILGVMELMKVAW